jgi:hypothetical protein
VGSFKEASGASNYKKPFAERCNGSSWSIQTTPSPAEAKGAVKLASVSCSASNACTAVGTSQRENQTTPPIPNQAALAERWNGSEWKAQEVLPQSRTSYSLLDVSCFPCPVLPKRKAT